MLNLDYFPGGVPPCSYFTLNVQDIKRVLSGPPDPNPSKLDVTAELCFIGLVAYFEAFFRHQFASLINLCPMLVQRLQATGRNVEIDAGAILQMQENPKNRIGFLLAEKYDPGSPRSVNSLFSDLLHVSPFSQDEARFYERVLNDRNLLVHHGGIFTVRYAGQVFVKRKAGHRLHFDSLVIRRSRVRTTANFCVLVAEKTKVATHTSLLKFISEQKIRISAELRESIGALAW